VSRSAASPEDVELPGRGRLEVHAEAGQVVFVPLRGAARRLDAAGLLAEPGRLARVASDDGRTALLARHAAERLWVFDAERTALRPVPGFARLRRAEELHLHAVADGYLVITENGVAALDRRGRERWRIDEVTAGWRLLEAAPGVHWLRDGAGNVLGLDAATGEEV
jgi:hypothetical protein